MITLETMTEEEKNKIKKYFDFYSQNLVENLNSANNTKKEKIMNTDAYQSYVTIVNQTANVLKEIGTIDPIVASAAFHYLLWSGYLSKNKELIYSISQRNKNILFPGTDVICGKSVCAGNSDLEATILRAMGYEAYAMGCLINSKEQPEFEYRPDIERKKDSNIKLSDRIISKIADVTFLKNVGNHAVTLLQVDNQYVISDATNLAYANFNGFMNAKYVGSNTEIPLKSWFMLMQQEMKYNKFQELALKAFMLSNQEVLTLDMLKQIYEIAINQCRRNSFLLDDFHDCLYHDIECVSKTFTKKIQ